MAFPHVNPLSWKMVGKQLVARSIPSSSTRRPVSYTRDLQDTNRRCYEKASESAFPFFSHFTDPRAVRPRVGVLRHAPGMPAGWRHERQGTTADLEADRLTRHRAQWTHSNLGEEMIMKKQLLASLVSLLVAQAVESVQAQTSVENPRISKAQFILSRIDDAATHEFKKAWAAVGAGADSIEAVVLLYKHIDGFLMARSLPLTYEFKKFGFGWNPAIIGVVHTHPNSSGSRPQPEDIRLADKFGVPVFTLTYRGMFIYDPDTRKVSLVQDGLDWLQPSRWNQDSRFVSVK